MPITKPPTTPRPTAGLLRPGKPARVRPLGARGWPAGRVRGALAALAADAEIEVLKAPANGRSSVLAFEAHGVELVAKCQALDSFKRWCRAALGGSSLDSQARAAARLVRAGVPVAPHVGIAIAPPALVLLTERVPGESLLSRLVQGSATPGDADAAGRGIALLAERRLDDRDHKPSNLVVSPGVDVPVLVDPAGVRARVPRVPRMLASLYIEPSGVGAAPRRSYWVRAARGAAPDHRAALRAAASIVRDHGDPRPKDALAPV